MNVINTEEVGRIYTLNAKEAGIADSRVEIGGKVTLESTFRSYGGANIRSWYLMGEVGMISFSGNPQNSLTNCETWLDRNGFEVQGDLPPEAFEYKRYNA